MEVWQQRFQAMKEQFVSRSGQRLKQIDDLIIKLSRRPSDANVLKELRQHFHWLAGSGGTYGFGDVTKLGSYGEEGCDYFLTRGQSPGDSDVERFRKIIEMVKEAFAGEAVETEMLSQETQAEMRGLDKEEEKNRPPDILLIDSDQATLLNVQRALVEDGMAVRSFRTLSGARDSMLERVPDGMVVSIPLLDGSGYELTEQCRTLTGGNKTAVIMLSKQSGFMDRVNAIHSGADAIFEHPFESKEMVLKMRHLLEKDKPELYRILHVEDDPDQAMFIKATLESAGYNVVSLGDPANFEEWLVAVQPDIVILDVMLGDITGFDLARYMRQDERYATVPILFLTTQNQLYAHIESARAGGDDHLVKPVPPPLLCSTVAGKLERARAVKALVDKDGMTKVLTHGAFMQKAESMARRSRGLGKPALLLMDLDNLREINARYGYNVGDKVLISLANLLKKRFRGTDIIGRLGGDEFAVILDNLEEAELATLATRILCEFEEIEQVAGDRKFSATFSAGACLLDDGMDTDRWMKFSDQALVADKKGGRNRVLQARAPKQA